MSTGSGNGGGGALGALLFVIGALVLFALMMTVFLIIPFFIFLAGIIAMMIADRKRNKNKSEDELDREKRLREAQDAEDRENARQRAMI
ncbi:MAG: hypothetical protein M3Y23_05070 [Actinomycetota bacterium]|nr:hypothetical protein [Actinomycetota bacterium]